MIPVGTLCYVVRSEVPGRIGSLCTVTAMPCGCMYCDLFADEFGGRHVAAVQLCNGEILGALSWSQLMPITPPKQSIDTKHDERIPA